MELEQYACYVIADGLDELYSSESASLATQTVILAFEEHPSMKKGALLSYLKEANQALLESGEKTRLKASITVIISNYEKIRYAHAGNTRFRLYRNGLLEEQSKDMSLGRDLVEVADLSDVLYLNNFIRRFKMNNYLKEIGARIRNRRMQLHYSQEYLAGLVDVTAQTIEQASDLKSMADIFVKQVKP